VLHSDAVFFLPGRRAMECERSDQEINIATRLHILSNDSIQRGLSDSKNRANRLIALGKSDRENTDELYLVCLGRLPNATERSKIAEHRERKVVRAEFFADIFWAILNTREFIQRR
jgi:hypothetical protein